MPTCFIQMCFCRFPHRFLAILYKVQIPGPDLLPFMGLCWLTANCLPPRTSAKSWQKVCAIVCLLWLSLWLTTQTCLGGFLFAPASLHWWIFSCLSQETSPPPNPEAVNFLRAYSRCGSGIKPCRPLSPRPVRAKAGADTEAPEAQGAETKVSYTLTASIPGISGTHLLLLL